MPDSVMPWAAAHQAPLFMRFSRQGYGSGLQFPSPGDLPNPGIEPWSPALQADSLLTELQGKPNKHKVRPRSPNQSTGFELPASYSKFPLAKFCTWQFVCFSATLSVHPTFSCLPPLFLQVCSLCLHLHCCLAIRFISLIFFKSPSQILCLLFAWLCVF